MTPHRRLFEVRSSLKMTQKQMASILGIGQNAYSMIETGKIDITLRNRSILERELGVNPNFLLGGELPMMLKKNVFGELPSVTVREDAQQGVPYYTKPLCSAGSLAKEFAPEEVEYYIDFQPFNDCTLYRPVFGQSMSPRYNPGDIIACKRVNKSNILYGQSYLCVITNAGDTYETLAILRREGDADDDTQMVVLAPVNGDFDSKRVLLGSIVELFLICGRIERYV